MNELRMHLRKEQNLQLIGSSRVQLATVWQSVTQLIYT